MKPASLIFPILFAVTGSLVESRHANAASTSADAHISLLGQFDNREQVAKGPVDAEHAIPHVTVTIEATPQKDFSLWHVHLSTDAETSYDQTWAVQSRVEYNGQTALIPYYQFKQTTQPVAATFDAQGWLSLEACALRGEPSKTRIQGMAEGEPCVASIMSVGARRALLPVGFDREGEWLHLDLNFKSARTRIDARRQ